MKNMLKCFLLTVALIAESFYGGWAMQAPLSTSDDLLIEAVKKGDCETVKRLLAEGANVNAYSLKLKGSALSWATYFRNLKIVPLLLAAKADVNAKDIGGKTALMILAGDWYIDDASIDIIRLLLAAGADVNAQNSNGYTALMLAIRESAIKDTSLKRWIMIQLLIEAQTDVNIQNKYHFHNPENGNTALMDVARARSKAPNFRQFFLQCAIALIKAGGDITLTNEDGKTALDLARENGNVEIVQLFECYLEAIHDCVVDEWRECPLEVIKEYVMPFLDPD
jgi:ankyrin repeat protein